MGDFSSFQAAFKNDGVVFLRGALDADAIQTAKEAFRWSVTHPGPAAAQFEGTEAAPARFYQDLINPDAMPHYLPMLERGPFANIVADVWGTPEVWFFYEQVFLKEGGEARRTPWHQDSSYLPIAGNDLAVMWISFDRLAKEDCLEFVRGSHRGPLYDGTRFDPKDDTAPLYGEGTLPRLPDIEKSRASYDIVSWAIDPGDIILFHPAMLHGGAPTHQGGRRRTLSLRFFGCDAVFSGRPGVIDVRPGAPESRFQEMKRTIGDGGPFRHPAYPKLRPR
jgi:ectoine hydroxylase-related dioxygenase (phytanoyl-CoA dioxygenase family)